MGCSIQSALERPCYTRSFVTRLMPVVSAICGAAFTVGVWLALGSLLLRRLGLEFHRLEAPLFAFVSGSACLSLATFVLCVVHQARLAVFLAGGAGVIGWAIWKAREIRRGSRLPAVPRAWLILFSGICGIFRLVISAMLGARDQPRRQRLPLGKRGARIGGTMGSTGITTASIRRSGREWRCCSWWRSPSAAIRRAALVHMAFQALCRC